MDTCAIDNMLYLWSLHTHLQECSYVHMDKEDEMISPQTYVLQDNTKTNSEPQYLSLWCLLPVYKHRHICAVQIFLKLN